MPQHNVQKMKKHLLLSYLVLSAFILFLIAHHLYAFFGHYGYDDLHYAQLAKNLLQGEFNHGDHYSYRFAILLPTALAYAVFGVSDGASALPPLCCSALILWLVFRALRQESPLVLALGLALTACSDWLLFYSDKLMPDIYVAFALILAVFVVDRYKYHSDQRQPRWYALVFVLALGLGWMAKETIVLGLPMLLYWLVRDMWKRQHLRFWAYSTLFGVIFLVLYFGLIGLWTGDVWARLNAIADNSYLNACSYDQQPVEVLLRRLYYDFFALSGTELLLFNLVFVLAYLFQKGVLKVFALPDSTSFYASSAILLFLASNFMSISPKAYVPMCVDARHYLFLIPVAAVPAARMLGEFLEQKRDALLLFIGLLLATIFVYSNNDQLFNKPYLPALILVGLYYFLPSTTNLAKALFTLLFLGILLIGPIGQWQYAHKVAYRSQKAITHQFFMDKNEPAYIITDVVQKRLGDYYNGFEAKAPAQFLSFDQFSFDTLDQRKKYLYLNWHTQYLSSLGTGDLPDYVRNLDTVLNPKVYQNKALNLVIYELKVQTRASQLGIKLLYSQNDFEQKQAYWDQNETGINAGSPYRGSAAYTFNEFSATFNFPLGELKKNADSGIRILVKAQVKVPGPTKAKLVISLENSTGAYFWIDEDLSKFFKVYGQWLPVQYAVDLPKRELKPNSRLKVYVWNEDKSAAAVDDFEVEIWELK